MTVVGACLLALIMCVLAAIPSSSVVLVVARSASHGIRNGFAAAAGIVAGDLIFVTLALLGMTALAENGGTFFVFIKYAAAAYLIWFGIKLLKTNRATHAFPGSVSRDGRSTTELLTSFSAGLLLTLGDFKAIFFYASLLPTFLDLQSLTVMQIYAISAITIVSVGGVKAAYAVCGQRLASTAKGFSRERELKIASGGLMITAGTYLIFKN